MYLHSLFCHLLFFRRDKSWTNMTDAEKVSLQQLSDDMTMRPTNIRFVGAYFLSRWIVRLIFWNSFVCFCVPFAFAFANVFFFIFCLLCFCVSFEFDFAFPFHLTLLTISLKRATHFQLGWRYGYQTICNLWVFAAMLCVRARCAVFCFTGELIHVADN